MPQQSIPFPHQSPMMVSPVHNYFQQQPQMMMMQPGFHPNMLWEPPRKKRKVEEKPGYRYSLASLGIPKEEIPQKLYALNNQPKIRSGDDRRKMLKKAIEKEIKNLEKEAKS